MAVGTPHNFAQCEINRILRDRSLTDLNIKGLVSCPDKVDVEAIRLVYDFADHTKEEFFNYYLFNDPSLQFLTQQIFPIYNCIDHPLASEFTLRELYCVIVLPVAGRVAMIGNYIRIHLRYLYNGGANNHEIGASEWLIAAGAGLEAHLRIAKNMTPLGAAASYAPAPTDQLLTIHNDPKLRNFADDYLAIFAWTDGIFPVGTGMYIYSSVSYK